MYGSKIQIRLKKTQCKPIKDEGLGMIDIFNYVKALKITWLQNLETNYTKWKPILCIVFMNAVTYLNL